MVPLSTKQYNVPVAGAEQFLRFIGDYPHVPFPSLYDGLKYVFEKK